MDYKYIEQLLERYWNCETSLEEEQILKAFFSQRDVPVSLLKYKDLFCYEQAETADDTLGSDFDARVMAAVNEPEPVKARTISLAQRFMPLFKAAAVVAIFLTLGRAGGIQGRRQARDQRSRRPGHAGRPVGGHGRHGKGGHPAAGTGNGRDIKVRQFSMLSL